MNKRLASTASLVLIATLGAAACGSDPKPATPAAAATTQVAAATTTAAPVVETTDPATTVVETTAPPAAGSTVAVKAGSSVYGQILVDEIGNSLYGFTNDTNAQTTCTGTCADAWPPVIVDANWTVAPGLDSGVFSTIIRPDGSEQLTAGRFPLYRFSGDARPGDINGQGSGSVWFLVDLEAKLISDNPAIESTDTTAAPATAPETTAPPTTAAAAPAPVTVVDNALGQILAGPDGHTVYGFTKDADGLPTCAGGCATAWPPVIVDASLDLSGAPAELNLSIVDRADGTKQLKAGKWPLYYFSGDAAPGETNGQGSGGSWFVLGADTKLIK